jgi:hypothetical protein
MNFADLPADEWQFYHYRDGRWTWRNMVGDHARESEQAFESWVAAMQDAIDCGFNAGESRIAVDGASRRAMPRLAPAR